MARLAGKAAVVTGAGSGIGEAAARLFAEEGAAVVVADINGAAAERVAAAITAGGGRAIGVAVDIAEEDQVAAMVRRAVDAFGTVDVLHANAALTDAAFGARDLDVLNMDLEVWKRAFAVNVCGTALCCKHVLPHMLKQQRGSIIITSSGKALEGDAVGMTAYGASKAAVINLARNIAAQYGKQGVRANALIVGLVATEALKASIPEAAQRAMADHHLTPDIGEPRQIAYGALFLASDESSFTTGQPFFVDGGFTSHDAVYADVIRARRAAAEA